MTTAFEESRTSIRLGRQQRTSEDDATLYGSAGMENSEPLLGEEARDREAEPQKESVWRIFPFHKSRHARKRENLDRAAGPDILGKSSWRNRCLVYGVGFLAVLGVVQLLTIFARLIVLAMPGRIDEVIGSWGKPGHIGAGLSHWPTDFTRDILPIPCHSHNDYWRTVPLYSAIEAGCIGVEADIWLFTDELYVGHSVESLSPNRTLSSLYISPLLEILSKQNQEPLVIPNSNSRIHGVFDTNPEQPLIFLIDFKTSGTELFPHVVRALEPLRSKGYLTTRNGSEVISGPVTVVGTGETPLEMVTSDAENPHHDIFFDAPLNEMYESRDVKWTQSTPKETKAFQGESSWEGNRSPKRHGGLEEGRVKVSSRGEEPYSTFNSYYASGSFIELIGVLLSGEFSDHQLDVLRGQIRGARRRGLKVRYWELPFWPINLRNHVWDVLVKEGVDLLNVDDLQGATKRDWSKSQGWWKRGR